MFPLKFYQMVGEKSNSQIYKVTLHPRVRFKANEANRLVSVGKDIKFLCPGAVLLYTASRQPIIHLLNLDQKA